MASPVLGKLTLLATLALGRAFAYETPPKPQLQFSAENRAVRHPVDIPDAVFEALVKHPAAQGFEGDNHPARAWFSAERLRAPSPTERLYLVMGTGPLRGANTVPFWLVRENTRTHHANVLWEASELSLSLSYKPRATYPQIDAALVAQQLVWESTWNYSHGKYLLVSSNEAKNKRKLDQPAGHLDTVVQ